MLAVATAIMCSSALAQCEDDLACNFQPGTTGTAECIYFDTDLFTLEEEDWMQELNFDACETGYGDRRQSRCPWNWILSTVDSTSI